MAICNLNANSTSYLLWEMP
uniref:Uncharacterized protein n=1 Tax=Anguilla anguilla TaxID=7936 RepID=A0A0E9RIZ6_ANGAN